jgi:cell division transport system permease protein
MSLKAEKYNRKGLRTRYVSTVVGVSLVLFLIGLVIGGALGLDSIQRQAKEKLQGDIFFKPEFNEADIKQIELKLKDWSEFSEVIFVAPDRALADFSGNDQKAQEIAAIFDGENPFPPSISFKPKEGFATINGMEGIVAKLQTTFGEVIDDVSYDVNSVQSVNLGFKQFAFLFLIVAGFLIIVAVAMINNTIRLALYSKRFTIKTMQLVGAKGGFIRRPFLWQSILQGVISAILGLALLVTLFYALNNFLDTVRIGFDPKSFALLSGSLLVIGILITFFSTLFALNKYLRMKLDDLY